MKLLNSPFAIFQGPKFLNAPNLVVEEEHPITRSDFPNPRTTPSQLRKLPPVNRRLYIPSRSLYDYIAADLSAVVPTRHYATPRCTPGRGVPIERYRR